MARQTRRQQQTVARVMHAFRHGDLTSGSGQTVRNPKQAVAIGLSEAGVARGHAGRPRSEGPSRADLYREAAARGINGRSYMTKGELERALQRR